MARAPLVRELFAFYRAQALLGVWLASPAAERSRVAAHVRSLLRSLEHAKTRFGAAFGPHAGAQLAWLEGDFATASRLARVAHERLGTMGHSWSRVAALLSTALDERESYWRADRELVEWHEARGFVSPEHAIALALPIHARLREHMPR